MTMSRRDALRALAAAGAACMLPLKEAAAMERAVMLERAIPSTGERLPVIGMGTWQTFDIGNGAAERATLREVLRVFHALGGRVIDSSPMYGRSESVVGELSTQLGLDDLFLATKVWTSGRTAGVKQMQQSFGRMRTRTMDLMQVHNLLDVATHLATIRTWKAAGRIRYGGITHYQTSSYDELERLLDVDGVDFVQLNFSIATREAERRMLPRAADTGTAVIVNRPFESGDLFRATRSVALPAWAAELGIESWGQFFLKYIVSHPAVTVVIPATSNPRHLRDNMAAGSGPLPDANTRRRMVQVIESL